MPRGRQVKKFWKEYGCICQSIGILAVLLVGIGIGIAINSPLQDLDNTDTDTTGTTTSDITNTTLTNTTTTQITYYDMRIQHVFDDGPTTDYEIRIYDFLTNSMLVTQEILASTSFWINIVYAPGFTQGRQYKIIIDFKNNVITGTYFMSNGIDAEISQYLPFAQLTTYTYEIGYDNGAGTVFYSAGAIMVTFV